MKKNRHLLISALYLFTVAVMRLGADVVFREDFTVYSETSLQDSGGWHAFYTSSGISVDESNTDFYNGPIIAGAIGDGGKNGFLLYQYDAFEGEPVLIFSDKQASFGTVGMVTNITFSLYNQSVAAHFKVAIKVDEDWYVSQAVFNGSGTWTGQSLDVQSAQWNSLNFTPGSILSEGGAATLPLSGTITSVGLFDASGISGYIGRTRIDSYVVNVIPEPATLSLFGISTACLILVRRCI